MGSGVVVLGIRRLALGSHRLAGVRGRFRHHDRVGKSGVGSTGTAMPAAASCSRWSKNWARLRRFLIDSEGLSSVGPSHAASTRLPGAASAQGPSSAGSATAAAAARRCHERRCCGGAADGCSATSGSAATGA